MYIVAGLGNPGDKYLKNLHTLGFMAVELLAEKHGVSFDKKGFKGLFGVKNIGGEKVIFLKPQTFMNLSGESLRAACDFFKIDPEQELIVIYDDIDLDAGRLRVRAKGSAGTHNGMRSVIGLLGRQDFPRLRVGVGKKPEGWELADWVLSHYQTEADRKTQFDAFLRAADVVDDLMKNGLESARRMANAPA